MEKHTVTTTVRKGVSYTFYTKDGIIVAECRRWMMGTYAFENWYRNGKPHRDDGPADICREGDQVRHKSWYRDGKLHREDGPAMIKYENGEKIEKHWCYNGVHHRDGGPAAIWYKDGQKNWCRDGKLCPIGVLASVTYDDINSVDLYWIGDRSTRSLTIFRDKVKGDAIHDALRPLPIPIRQAIIPHYCYQ